MGTGEFTSGGNTANLLLGVTLRWTSIPSRGGGGGSTNTPSRFMLRKPGYAPACWATRLVYRLYLLLKSENVS